MANSTVRPIPNLQAVSTMQVRSRCSTSGKPSARYSDTKKQWVQSMSWVSQWENKGWRTMTAPLCTMRHTWRRKEWYSPSERLESICMNNLCVGGTSFTSFGARIEGGAISTFQQHRHGHMHEGHDRAQNCCRWPYGHGLEEDIVPHFGAEDEVRRC